MKRIATKDLYDLAAIMQNAGMDVSMHGYNGGHRVCNRSGDTNVSDFYTRTRECWEWMDGYRKGYEAGRRQFNG